MLERLPSGIRSHPQRVPGVMLEEAVAAFWRHHSRRRSSRISVERLAEIALASDPRIAEEGTRVLFERIVEPLCDGFTQRGAETYRRLFAQIIEIARRKSGCSQLHEALLAAGLAGERDLLRTPAPKVLSAAQRERVQTVIVLSRMTLGADVAISMPVLRRTQAAFPNAQIAFLGTDEAGVIARSFSRVTHVKVPYERSAFLADRLNVWPALLAAVNSVRGELGADRHVLIDPDSRLTQLGLLRPVSDESYFHFPSRRYGIGGTEPLGILACRWMTETFGSAQDGKCVLSVADRESDWAQAVRELCGSPRPLVAAHFGVGGNDKKRAGLEFETELVEWLVDQGCRVLLARGVGRAEIEETYRLCRRLADRRIVVTHLPTGCSVDDLTGRAADVLTWEASVDAFIATIACADAYVGYDSAGQHIAAALGVPALSLFIEASGRRHASRWTPIARGPVQVVRSPWPPDRRAMLEHARSAYTTLAREIAARKMVSDTNSRKGVRHHFSSGRRRA